MKPKDGFWNVWSAINKHPMPVSQFHESKECDLLVSQLWNAQFWFHPRKSFEKSVILNADSDEYKSKFVSLSA